MSFAAAMGIADLGIKAFSAWSANKQAKKQLKFQKEQFAFMKQMAERNNLKADELMELAQLAFDNTAGLQGYYKDINSYNMGAQQELVDYLRAFADRTYNDLGEERDYAIGRQTFQDQAEQEQRRYILDMISRNQGISEQERNFALQLMEREQGIASRERDQESADIERFQRGRQSEYQERYQRLLEDRAQRMRERDYEQQKQDRILAQTSALRDGISRVLQQQGRLTPPELLGPEAIEAEAARRGGLYTEIMDRLAEKTMSQNEASLIRRGMDTGADSGERRAEVIARLAPEYQKALMQAHTEAVGIVEGKNKTLQDRFENLRRARMDALGEAQMELGSGLDIEAGLRELGSGIVDRDIGSGTEYMGRNASELGVRGPMDVGSAIYDKLLPSSGYSDYITPGSRQMAAPAVGRGYTPTGIPQLDYGSIMSNSTALRGGSLQAGGTMLQSATDMAKTSGQAAGRATYDFLNSLRGYGSQFGDYLQNKTWEDFGRRSQGGTFNYDGLTVKPPPGYKGSGGPWYA